MHNFNYFSSQPIMDLTIKLQYFIVLLLATISSYASEKNVDCNPEVKEYLSQKGEKAIGAIELLNSVVISAPDIERFANMQIQLEDIADDSNLYGVSEEDRQQIMFDLYQNPKVQKIMKDCNEFHVQINCGNYSYRTADGTCNNLKYPKWGSSLIAKDYLLPPAYEGARGFRKSVTGKELLNPRSISLKLKQRHNPSTRVSALFVFFGQMIAHDMTVAPISTVNGSTPVCCFMRDHPACHPYDTPTDDPFYPKFNVTCQEFFRATPYPNCDFNKRRIMNKVTSFIDASAIYGSDDARSRSLRTNDQSGKLKFQNSLFGQLLPSINKEIGAFCKINKSDDCFKAGDERSNQHTMLMVIQTIFLRYHNLIADKLHSLNPFWKGDKIYYEARRTVGAVFQYIVYAEYIPLLIGIKNMDNFDLGVSEESYYDEAVRPIDLNEFSTAAFRLHSMVPSRISKFDTLEMKSSFSESMPLFRGEINSLLIGSSELPAEQFDKYFIDDIKNFLYKSSGATYGFDLIALNIQRNRDFGLAPYIDLIKECSDRRMNIRNFNDLNQLMEEENVELLKSIYEDVADIDLWIGLLMEGHVEGGEVGGTTSCILSKQFHRLKFGDSFYFTHVNGRYPFTKEQLKSIKTESLAKIICQTTGAAFIRRQPLQIPHENNPITPCSAFSPMDFTAWKEETP